MTARTRPRSVSAPPTGDALVVPDPRRDVVPAGWWQTTAAPVLRTCSDWTQLDSYEAQLVAMANRIEALGESALEFEKARRLIECRRGVLLGDPGPGRPTPADNLPRAEDFDVAGATASRYRTIAKHWDRLLYPRLLEETDPHKVTQAALLRLIAHERPPPSPQAARSTGPAPEASASPTRPAVSTPAQPFNFQEACEALSALIAETTADWPPAARRALPPVLRAWADIYDRECAAVRPVSSSKAYR